MSIQWHPDMERDDLSEETACKCGLPGCGSGFPFAEEEKRQGREQLARAQREVQEQRAHGREQLDREAEAGRGPASQPSPASGTSGHAYGSTPATPPPATWPAPDRGRRASGNPAHPGQPGSPASCQRAPARSALSSGPLRRHPVLPGNRPALGEPLNLVAAVAHRPVQADLPQMAIPDQLRQRPRRTAAEEIPRLG
jgi:hypothetical protein